MMKNSKPVYLHPLARKMGGLPPLETQPSPPMNEKALIAAKMMEPNTYEAIKKKENIEKKISMMTPMQIEKKQREIRFAEIDAAYAKALLDIQKMKVEVAQDIIDMEAWDEARKKGEIKGNVK